jgi:ribonuclease HI
MKPTGMAAGSAQAASGRCRPDLRSTHRRHTAGRWVAYTKDACTTPPHVPKPVKNRTAIVVCQRTLQAAADKRVLVRWVKVKGHSNEEGNDMADKLANYAQKGGAQNEQDIAMMMAGLQATDEAC